MKVDLETITKFQLPPNWRSLLIDLPNQPGFSKIPLIITGLLILLLTSSLASFTWMLFDTNKQSLGNTATTRVNRASSNQAPSIRLSDVANAHLFGIAKNKSDNNANSKIVAPITRLQLTLKGLLAIDDPKLAIAIIASANGKEKHYRTGEKITSSVTLHRIYTDSVILSISGKLEKLMLPKVKLSANAVSRTPIVMKSRQVRAGSDLKKLRDNLLKNPQDIWKNIRIEPKMSKSGAIQGYTLNHKDKKLMRSLGIRKTDVVTAVNGLPLNDPTSLYQILDVLKTTQQLNLSIIRNGTEQTLNIDMM